MTVYTRWLEMLIAWCDCNQYDHAKVQAEKLDRTPMFKGISAELERMRQRSDGRMTGQGEKCDG